MPTYVYKCTDNGHVFELVQKFSADAGAKCPTCGSESKRQITAPTVIYKGSGFYTTDYGSGSSQANSKPSNGSSSDSSKSSDSDSESDSSSPSKSSTESKKSDSGKDNGSSDSHGGASHSHGAGSHTH